MKNPFSTIIIFNAFSCATCRIVLSIERAQKAISNQQKPLLKLDEFVKTSWLDMKISFHPNAFGGGTRQKFSVYVYAERFHKTFLMSTWNANEGKYLQSSKNFNQQGKEKMFWPSANIWISFLNFPQQTFGNSSLIGFLLTMKRWKISLKL